jgi:hypothetical protein
MSTASLALPSLRHSVGRALAAALGLGSIVALLAISLRVATAATVGPSYLVPAGRRFGYPLWMHGPLTGGGSTLSTHGLVVLMAAMCGAWVLTLACAWALPPWVVASAVVLGVLIFALAPPLLSTDVFNYIAYGRMEVRGISPYDHGPAVIASDPVYPYTGHLWAHVPSAYGPLFTLLSYALAPLGIAGALWAFKAITAAACLAIAWFAWATARRLGRSPSFALAFAALNPALLIYGVAGAHNDLLMAAFLAAAIYLVVRGAPAWAGAALAGAVAIKVTAGLAAPFILLAARPRRRALLGFAAAGVALGAVSLAVFGTAPLHMLDALRTQRRFDSIISNVPTFVAHWLRLARPGHPAFQVLTALAAVAIVGLIALARRGKGWLDATAVAAVVLIACAAWVLPWYVVLALPFAAVAQRAPAPALVAGLTVLLLAMQMDHFALGHHHHHHHAFHHRHHHRSARTRQSRLTATYFVSRNSSSPQCPPSRPRPDCLTPPNGAPTFETMPWFRPIIPVSSPSQTRSARFMSRVKT